MARVATPALIQQLESLFDSGSLIGLTDRQLLERFNARRDRTDSQAEAAFTALVQRHGPMVSNVCRQILADPHHAEDAFQAVFLVLARRARSIRDPEKLTNWLYGTALRTARCLKPRLNRQRQRETSDLTDHPSIPSAEQLTLNHEQAQILHDEIARLPQHFRHAIVLHHLEGLSLEQAATHLAWPQGTLRSRLASAREKLNRRLTKRGMTLGAMLEPVGGFAHLPATLGYSTARAAVAFAAGKSAGITISTAIASKILRATGLSQTIKLTTICLIPLLAALGATAGYLGPQLPKPAQRPQEAGATKPQKISAPEAQPAKPKLAAEPSITVTGRVLDPSGNPVKSAHVYLIHVEFTPPVVTRMGDFILNLSADTQTKTNSDGRFELKAANIKPAQLAEVALIATAPGFGLGQAELKINSDQPQFDIKLTPERVVRLRLVDINGAPAAGVKLYVNALERGEFSRIPYDQANDMSFASQAPFWPKVDVTDAQGRVDIAGIPVDFSVALMSHDIRFAQQDLVIKPLARGASQDTRITLVLEPAQIIEGRVLAEDTGQPIPNAIVTAMTQTEHGATDRDGFTAKFQADAQGRFKINPVAGDGYILAAIPTGGEPYLILQQELIWKKGAITTHRDIKLSRGVSIQGKVTDLTTGEPIAGAAIEFIPGTFRPEILCEYEAIVASKQDGSFQINVIPGKGYLRVFSPKPGYVVEEIGSHQLETNKPGGWRVHAQKIIPYDVKRDGPPIVLSAQFRPGITIKGRVTGPKDEPIPQGEIIGAPENNPSNPCFPISTLQFRDGQFELHGLDPAKTTRVWLIDDDHKWGTTIDLAAREAGKDITIKLQPCGQAKARFIGPDGKPIPGYQPDLEFIVKDGPHTQSANPQDQAQLAAEAQSIDQVDRVHYADKPKTDSTGRIAFPALIPGAHYRINDLSTAEDPTKGVQVRKDFGVRPGETLELGDILIEKPKP